MREVVGEGKGAREVFQSRAGTCLMVRTCFSLGTTSSWLVAFRTAMSRSFVPSDEPLTLILAAVYLSLTVPRALFTCSLRMTESMAAGRSVLEGMGRLGRDNATNCL